MSRTTDINVNVNSGQSVATLKNLKEAFIGLKASVDAVKGNDEKIKLGLDVAGVDPKAIKALGSSLKTLATHLVAYKNIVGSDGKIPLHFIVTGETPESLKKIGQGAIGLGKGVEALKRSIGSDGRVSVHIDVKGADLEYITKLNKMLQILSTKLKKVKAEASTLGNIGSLNLSANTNHITNNNTKMPKVAKVSTEAKLATDDLNAMGSASEKATDTFQKGMHSATIALSFFKNSLKSVFSDFASLTDATFAIGISAQMNISQINALNQSFLNLSTTVPASATELAVAVDALIRTGRGFEDSKKIIEEVAILSSASGDSLKDTASVVTKVMVALGIGGDKVKETLTTMHSTAIQTASDMGYLAEGFKQVAGSASVLVKQSGKSGAELEEYRQKVLDVSMASIGSMANLGLSASTAGTKVKVLMTKLSATEASAKKLFNTAMQIGGIKFDINTGDLGKGNKDLDFETISNLTKTDLPKALQIMSELYNTGKLSTQVMQKMFTARHFMEISNLFIDMAGNVDGFVASIAKGISYSNDFYKSTLNINTQLKLA
ncbi:MAG: phage tail tape measure protein, partial [Fusobacteriaceae bacterium]